MRWTTCWYCDKKIPLSTLKRHLKNCRKKSKQRFQETSNEGYINPYTIGKQKHGSQIKEEESKLVIEFRSINFYNGGASFPFRKKTYNMKSPKFTEELNDLKEDFMEEKNIKTYTFYLHKGEVLPFDISQFASQILGFKDNWVKKKNRKINKVRDKKRQEQLHKSRDWKKIQFLNQRIRLLYKGREYFFKDKRSLKHFEFIKKHFHLNSFYYQLELDNDIPKNILINDGIFHVLVEVVKNEDYSDFKFQKYTNKRYWNRKKKTRKVSKSNSAEEIFISKYEGKPVTYLMEKLGFGKKGLKNHFKRLELNLNLSSVLDRESILSLKKLIKMKENKISWNKQKLLRIEKNKIRKDLKEQRKRKREDNWASKYHYKYSSIKPIYTGMKD